MQGGVTTHFSYTTTRSLMHHLKLLKVFSCEVKQKSELTLTVLQASDAVGLHSPLREQVDGRLFPPGVLREPQPAVFHSASTQHR